MLETLLLAAGVPVTYVLGMIITMRIIAWDSARKYYELQKHDCSCRLRKSYQPPWDSPADALHNAMHSCDWWPVAIGGIIWPVLLVVYAFCKPVHWFIMREPREKLTSAERERRVERQLADATAAMTAAITDNDDDDGCGNHGYGHR